MMILAIAGAFLIASHYREPLKYDWVEEITPRKEIPYEEFIKQFPDKGK